MKLMLSKATVMEPLTIGNEAYSLPSTAFLIVDTGELGEREIDITGYVSMHVMSEEENG